MDTWTTCAICGEKDLAGTGAWACHCDEDVTPVHRGPCFITYSQRKAEAKAEAHLIEWLALWHPVVP